MRRVYLRDWREHFQKRATTPAERKHWSLEAIGARIGLSHGYLSRVERGERPYSEEILEGLANEFQCAPVDLLLRAPTDPEDLFTICQQLRGEQRSRARGYLESLRDNNQQAG